MEENCSGERKTIIISKNVHLPSDVAYCSLNMSNGSTFWQNKLVLAFLIILWRPVDDNGFGLFYNESTHNILYALWALPSWKCPVLPPFGLMEL